MPLIIVIVGLLICLSAMLVGQIFNERAYRKLGPEEKVRLFDGFSNLRLWGSASTLMVIIIFLPLLYFYSDINKRAIWCGAFIAMAALRTVFLHFYTQRRYAELEIPEGFTKASRVAEIIKAMGWAVFFGTVIAWLLGNR